jgi:hypothetical protein
MGGFHLDAALELRRDRLESGRHRIAAVSTQAASATRWVRQISAKYRLCPELLALADAIERFADRLD